ncbi:glycosyltransferase [Polynucleobacter kasalickyi]|uniref:Glycosyltransferase involved in cell wall bisynthesis n=1 Tax=Polynucleobacter kasalickyi TaxID=1938817 RepID=A0A1W2CA23_9BURK|nr:glycosyltransferase [Polynucleobacter kasalickyi]SMC82020.1 Glycosyltransferase involved in cell wall bisynthesis [Polynucleobacter kasalickyi]
MEKNNIIIHLLPSISEYGGTARRVLDLVEKNNNLHKIFLYDVWMEEDTQKLQKLKESNKLKDILISEQKKSIIFFLYQLLKLKKQKKEIFLVSYFPRGYLFGYFSRLFKISKSYHICLTGINYKKTVQHEILFKYLYTKSNGIISNSKYTLDKYLENGYINKNSTILYNPVTKYINNYTKPKTKVIGACGGLTKIKNYESLILALDKSIIINQNCNLILLGNGPHKEELMMLISEDLKNNIIFEGYQILRDNLNRFSIFVHPCEVEGFGLAPIEAALSGLEVIISDKGACQEIIGHLNNVHIVDTKNLNLISKSIKSNINKNNSDFEQIKTIREELSIKNYSNKFEMIIINDE